MECKVLVGFCFLIVLVESGWSSMVDLKSEWSANVGWVISCSWSLYQNDSLQSVRLYEDDKQFIVYRPETHGNDFRLIIPRATDKLLIQCKQDGRKSLTGSCVLTIEPSAPPAADFSYSCEVSGERPMFRIEKKSLDVELLVPPTKAVLEIGQPNEETSRTMINCTSSGLPAPQLVWTIGEQKVPADFTGTYWNETSKLLHVWSQITYLEHSKQLLVCSPQTILEGIRFTLGQSATYNSAQSIQDANMILAILIPVMLLR